MSGRGVSTQLATGVEMASWAVCQAPDLFTDLQQEPKWFGSVADARDFQADVDWLNKTTPGSQFTFDTAHGTVLRGSWPFILKIDYISNYTSVGEIPFRFSGERLISPFTLSTSPTLKGYPPVCDLAEDWAFEKIKSRCMGCMPEHDFCRSGPSLAVRLFRVAWELESCLFNEHPDITPSALCSFWFSWRAQNHLTHWAAEYAAREHMSDLPKWYPGLCVYWLNRKLAQYAKQTIKLFRLDRVYPYASQTIGGAA